MIDSKKARIYANRIHKMSDTEKKMMLDVIRQKVGEIIGFNYSNKQEYVEAMFDYSETSKLINTILDLNDFDCPDCLRNLNKDEKWMIAYLINSL